MTLEDFLKKLNTNPNEIEFEDTMAVIDGCYRFTPSKFTNGDQINPAGENSGSCKIFAFGKLNNLSPEQTLACFGHYYRIDVLQNPDGDDHSNIRNFMHMGWDGIEFDNQPLEAL